MRLLVCEYVTGGGLVGTPLPAGLVREGDMMLRRLVKDLAGLGNVEPVVARDGRLPVSELPGDIKVIGAGDDPWEAWRWLMHDVDAVWPIAPETGGVLERLSELVVETGPRLLGSRPAAVRLCASKSATAARLIERNVAAVPTRLLSATRPLDLASGDAGWVVKPDDGAGAESIRLVRRRGELANWREAARDEDRLAVQPYIEGEAASLSLLCRDGLAWLLSCNDQDVAIEDGWFRYRGGIVGGREARRAAYEPLAKAVAAAIPELWGYVGVDLVDGPDGPVIVEINPRLTTSYARLGDAIGINPAGLVLELLQRGISTISCTLSVTPQPFSVVAEHV